MRILIFHGYLLRGTGSNVYNASLAAALVGLGHEVHLLCQDREPFELDFVDAAGDWDGGRLEVRERRAPARCTVYRPDIGGLLPVYVADRYAGIEARPFPELDDEELEGYVGANVGAVRDVVERVDPEVALANHLVMGPVVLARALGQDREHARVPYAVKVHGSALEYTVKPHPRFLGHACEGLAGAQAVLVGSRHTARSLWAAMDDDPGLPARTRLGPPGVDVQSFAPLPPPEAAAALHGLATRLEARSPARADTESAFARDDRRAARALSSLDPGAGPIVVFVGKLILAKGVDLLLAAWPLVSARVPGARLVVIGFGAFAAGAQRMVDDLGAGDLAAVSELARRGRAAEGGPAGPLDHLQAFLDALEGDSSRRTAYRQAAGAIGDEVVFTGRLEHAELAQVLPAGQALVVPSTFPEAFGMVAAEAAACGVLPVSAEHSGLAEVTRVLGAAVPGPAGPMLSFRLGPGAVEELAECLVGWLTAPEPLRADTREALVATARERYSWEGVARGVIDAARGRLDQLPEPIPAFPDASGRPALG